MESGEDGKGRARIWKSLCQDRFERSVVRDVNGQDGQYHRGSGGTDKHGRQPGSKDSFADRDGQRGKYCRGARGG